jgi:hypothetical protein
MTVLRPTFQVVVTTGAFFDGPVAFAATPQQVTLAVQTTKMWLYQPIQEWKL